MARRISRRPSAEWRVVFLGFAMLCCFGVLLGKLWYEQVLRGAQWSKKIAGRSEVTVRIPSMRGEIRDRNGLTLVTNRASYGVDFYLPDLERGYRAQYGSKVPVVGYEQTIKNMRKKMREADIVQIVNTTVMPRLDELDLAQDYNSERLQLHYRNARLVPFTYQEDLVYETIARFSEHDLGLPGVDIAVKPVRQYLYGALAVHLLGYVGAPNDIDKLPDIGDYTFYQPDVEGKSQVELVYDKWIRGTPGVRVMQRSSKGVIMGEIRREAPKTGNNVYLTIDAKIQFITERALRAVGRGAAVVINPKNGDILAMASVPSYDPNIFIPSVSVENWNKVNGDETDPLTNRAIQGYAPGSTYKTVTALAGLRAGISADRYFNCSGSVTYGNKAMKCWIAEKGGAHGTLGLADSLKVSCDCFFYQFGNAASIETIEHFAKLLGIGQHYDLGLADVKDGIMPSPEWMRMKYPELKWSNAHTANVTIGQGYVLASPLQMAMAYGAIANGGVIYEPRLVRKVLTPEGQPFHDEKGQIAIPDQPKIHGDLRNEVTPEQINIIRQGLWKVVNEKGGPGGGGTGAKAKLANVVVAAKTGTAQASDRGKKDTIAWFCSFAPFEKPRYVICTMVQGGRHGGSVAGPIAARIMEQCLAMDQGTYKPEILPLTPAKSANPFASIETLSDYKDAQKVIVSSDEDDASAREPSTAKIDLKSGSAKPDIRLGTDARGKVKGQGLSQSSQKPNHSKPTEPKRNFIDRIFGRKPAQTPTNNQPSAPLKPVPR